MSTLEYSGANILDIDEFTADGSTVNYLTNIRWNENVSTIISVDGKLVPNDIVESTKADVAPNNIMIKFATPPKQDSIIRYAVFQGEVQNYSAVTIDEFEADGSTSYYTLTQTPFTQTPAEWYTIVRLNDKILNAGYNEVFDVTATREYRLKLYQVNAITAGTDAQGEVTVRVVKDELIVNGHGADTDIVKASVLAYLNAINKIYQNPDLATKKLSGI